MKKFMFVWMAFVVIFSCAFPTTASATYDLENNFYSVQQVELSEQSYAVYSQPRTTGLITDCQLVIEKNSNNILHIEGYTEGTNEVIKCGFTEIIVERRTNSSSSWSEYYTYEDLYSSSNEYTLDESLTVTSGYQYRVTATHYAKKSLFSTEKITGTTGALTF